MSFVSEKAVKTRAGAMWTYAYDKKVSRAIAECGAWEEDVADAVERYVQPGMTFLDMGAHIGFFSCLAAQKGAHVIAVEPHPAHFHVLLRNLAGLPIEPHNVALWDYDGWAEMELVDVGNSGSTWVTPRHRPTSVPVACRTLDSILGERRPEVIKADIEGAELRVLKKSKALEHCKVLITEYSTGHFERTSNGTGRQYYDLLCDAGFNWYTLSEKPVTFEELPTGGYANYLLRRD